MCPDLQAPELLERLPPSFCEGVDVRYARNDYASELYAEVVASHSKCYARGCEQPPPSLAKLLLLYFEYMLHVSKRGSCLAVRRRGPKSERAQKLGLPAGPKGYLLPKYACWPGVDQERLKQRLSIEDPFETHDCPEPSRRHDCAANVSKEGMAQLLSEWRRAVAMLVEANHPEVTGGIGEEAMAWANGHPWVGEEAMAGANNHPWVGEEAMAGANHLESAYAMDEANHPWWEGEEAMTEADGESWWEEAVPEVRLPDRSSC